MTRASTSYDEMPYEGRAYAKSHPDRLATLAALYGMTPPPIAACRVLELGCGDGSNLIPMACGLPGSAFVGIDLSGVSIEKGRAAAQELGLRNIELRHGDLMALGSELGAFDYIIAHGLYSWVPPPVREKVLAIFAESLAPTGVAYLSYNCYPAGHLKGVTRDIMLYHTRGIADPARRVKESRAIVRLLHQAVGAKDVYGAVLWNQANELDRMDDGLLFHDDLSPWSTPFLVSEVAADGVRHGLQYVADALVPPAGLGHRSEPVDRFLRGVDDPVAREQYSDFLSGRSFRQTLFCRAEIELDRDLEPASLRRFHLSAAAEADDETIDPMRQDVEEFKIAGRTVSVDHPLSKAALLHLAAAAPEPIAFDALIEGALARLAAGGDTLQEDLADHLEAVEAVLFQLYASAVLELSLYPPRLTKLIGERPLASPVARLQARTGSLITNLLHKSIAVEDEMTRKFLTLVDGTRTADDIVDALSAFRAGRRDEGPVGNGGAAFQVSREIVAEKLATAARLGLLLA
jgi:SAM-dependent methyltransferase